MNKNISVFYYFLIFIIFSGCSIDNMNTTGYWNGFKKEKDKVDKIFQQQNPTQKIKLYSSENIFDKEINPSRKIILSKAKKNISWQMSGMNLQNYLGNIYFSGADNIFLKKKIGKNKFSLSKNISSPLIFEDNIIFSDDTGTIFNINPLGKVIWKKNIYKKLYKKIYKTLTLSIYESDLYAADNLGFIYKINLKNGQIIWLKNHGIPLKSNLKIFKGKLFIINQDNRVLCFDTKEGALLWDLRSVSSFIKSQGFLSLAISKEEDLIVLNSAGDLIKIKSQNGRVYWTLGTLFSLYAHDTDFFSSSNIVVIDNEIIFSTSSFTFSFDLESGQLNWRTAVGSTNTPIIDKDNIFLVSNNGYLVNLDKESGDIIFSKNILNFLKKKDWNKFFTTPFYALDTKVAISKITGAIMGSGKIYATSLNGYLIICSAVTGEIEGYKKIADMITAPLVISKGSLYVLTEKSRIIGFN